MGIRSKFLIVLIFFSVIPLLVFYLMNQKLFTKLGDDIFQIATVLLLQTTAKELQDSADNYTRNLNREITNIVRHVENYRDDVEITMEKIETKSQKENRQVLEQIARQMPQIFRKIQDFRNDIVSIKYFSKSGFTHTYPISESNRAKSNPFREDVSSEIDRSNIPLWDLPSVHRSDTSEIQYVSVGLPVHSSSGLILGYVTLDFDVIRLLNTIRPSSRWAEYKESLLLEMGSFQKVQKDFPLVIGVRSPRSGKTEWKAEMLPLKITPSIEEETTAIFKGMHYGEAGYVSLPYEGEPSIWAYSKTDFGLGILNTLPEREALYRIARHPGRLSKWLTLDSLIIVSVVVVIMVIIVAYRSRRMLEPFFTMISAFKSVAAGNFLTKLEFDIRDERQMIADAFNNMTVQLEDGMRMRQGLEVAKEVQQNFFPKIDPYMSDLDIAIRMSYCEETGGDHIDVLKGTEGKVCIVVGDVTGHGIGAALHVATLRALIRGRYKVDCDLASVITSVNSELTIDMGDSGRFVTLFILEINPISRKFRWVRAGHDPAWLYCKANGNIVSLSGPGIILGVDSEFIYSENYSDQLESGDVIIIGTDGIWETCDPKGNQFGKMRLEQIVSETSHKTASDICDSLISAVDNFRKGQNQEDDVSIVVIKTPEY